MSNPSCRLPGQPPMDEYELIRRLLQAQRIAVVGLSDDPSKPSYYVSKYMQDAGKEIIPVNPSHETVFGVTCYPSLDAVPDDVDLVNVFRRPNACPEVVRAAIRKGVKGVWLQAGITSDEACKLARDAGLDYIENRCIMVEHRTIG